MKLNFDELAQLAQQEFPVYAVISDELLLQEETVQYLVKLAQKRGYLEHKKLQFSAQGNWDSFFEEIQNMSLFSSKKMIEIELPTGNAGKQGADIFLGYAQKIPVDIILILRLPKLTAAQQKNKWFTELEKVGAFITIAALTKEQFPHWLKRRLSRAKIEIANDALHALADLTEGNLLAAKQAVERLQLLYGERKLELSDIQFALSDSSQYDMYTLLDAALKGEPVRSTKILAQLKASGAEANLLIWLFSKEVRTLAQLAQAKKQQTLQANTWQTLGVWRQRQPLMSAHLKRFKYEQYLGFIQQLAQLDQMAKGAIAGNVWQQLENFIVEFSK